MKMKILMIQNLNINGNIGMMKTTVVLIERRLTLIQKLMRSLGESDSEVDEDGVSLIQKLLRTVMSLIQKLMRTCESDSEVV